MIQTNTFMSMNKKLLLSSVLLLTNLIFAGSVLLAQQQISFTTGLEKGAEFNLVLKSNGKVTIEGATKKKTNVYIVDAQTITLKGEILSFMCERGEISKIDLSQASSLELLTCNGNKLTELDVSKNPLLEEIVCFENEIKELDLSQQPNLKLIFCNNNQLTKIVCPQDNAEFAGLICYGNLLKGEPVDDIVKQLPSRKGMEEPGVLMFVDAQEDGNICTKKQVADAFEKGWIVYDSMEMPYNGSDDVSLQEILNQEQADIVTIYNLRGERMQQLEPGVNLICLSNGAVRKVIVK